MASLVAPLIETPPLQSSLVSDINTGVEIEDAFATLSRDQDGVELTFDTLLPIGTYTGWWVIFNNPEFCVDGCGADDFERPEVNASIFWATGEVVSAEGMASFSAQLGEGETPSGADQVLFGEGLEDSFKAEIHPIIRTHGLPIPGLVEEQITTFNGGCPPNECFDVQVAVFPSVSVTVDFEGEDLSAGDLITDQFADLGLTISTPSEFGAMLFDTNNPTGGDLDLAASGLGNVLILSEDGDVTDPDDNAQGGVLTFEWDELVGVTGIGLLDIDEPGGSITFYDEKSNVIETVDIPELGNNSFQELDLYVENVARMDISLASSGAVTAVDFIPADNLGVTSEAIAAPADVLAA